MSTFAVLLFAGQCAAAHHGHQSGGKRCSIKDISNAVINAENENDLFTFPDDACNLGLESNAECPLKCKNHITTITPGKALCNNGTATVTQQPKCQVDAPERRRYETGVICMGAAFPSCQACDPDWCKAALPAEKCKWENEACVAKEAGPISPPVPNSGPGPTPPALTALPTPPAPGNGVAPGGVSGETAPPHGGNGQTTPNGRIAPGGVSGETAPPHGGNGQTIPNGQTPPEFRTLPPITSNNAQCENLKSENQNLKSENQNLKNEITNLKNENDKLKNDKQAVENGANLITNELNQCRRRATQQPSNNRKPQRCVRDRNARRWKCSGLPCRSTRECFTTRCRKMGGFFGFGGTQKCC